MSQVALILFAGPEMPCKLQHAFIFARDVVQRGGEATVIFEGDALKWLLELHAPEHKLRGMLLKAKQEGLIGGVCKGCALMHGAVDAAVALDLPLIDDASGHVSLAVYLDQGYDVITL